MLLVIVGNLLSIAIGSMETYMLLSPAPYLLPSLYIIPSNAEATYVQMIQRFKKNT